MWLIELKANNLPVTYNLKSQYFTGHVSYKVKSQYFTGHVRGKVKSLLLTSKLLSENQYVTNNLQSEKPIYYRFGKL